jgi:hypothetical protein
MDNADTQRGHGPTKGQNDRDTGEPCAVKAACTVRGGAVRKGLQKQYLACRLLYTDVEKKAQDTPVYCLSSGARGKDADMWGMGPLKDHLGTLAPYGITEGDGWSPVHAERRGWLSRIQQQEDAMAEQTAAALQPHRGSLPQGAQVRVILRGRGKVRSKKRRGRNR